MSVPANPRVPQAGVGLIAGNGDFPKILFERLSKLGKPIVIAGVHGQASPKDFSAAPWGIFKVGEIRAVSQFFLRHGISYALMAGGIDRQTLWRHFTPDFSLLVRIPGLLCQGDDAALRCIARLFGQQGIEIGDSTPFITDLLAPNGHLAGPAPGADMSELIARGVAQCRDFVRNDNGQALTVFGKTWTGRESIEGTNALLARTPGPGAVLVKMKKRTQDIRFDRPTIGPSTVRLSSRVGVSVIVVEANEVLLIDKERVVEHCERFKISLLGI